MSTFSLKNLNTLLRRRTITEYPHMGYQFFSDIKDIIVANDPNRSLRIGCTKNDRRDRPNLSISILQKDANKDEVYELNFEMGHDHSNCGVVTIYNLYLDVYNRQEFTKKKMMKQIDDFLNIFQKKITINTAFYTCLVSDSRKFGILKQLNFVPRSRHKNLFRTLNEYILMTRDVKPVK